MRHSPNIAIAGCSCPCCKDAFSEQEHQLAKLTAENERLQKPLDLPDKETAKQLRRIARRERIKPEPAEQLVRSTNCILRRKAAVPA